jgi:activator of HSP90 ATPase
LQYAQSPPSRLITIYDVKIELKWSGKASDGTEANGQLVIPEVSHEVTLDGLSEYTVRFPIHPFMIEESPLMIPLIVKYNWTLSTTSSKPVDALYQLVRQRLPVALEAKFAEFPTAIIETHGRDLTVSTEPSRSGTPVQATNAAPPNVTTTAPTPKPAVKNPPPKKKAVNTSTVEVEATFMASADDLFSIFTDEKRIPAWTRAPAQASLISCAYIHVSNAF